MTIAKGDRFVADPTSAPRYRRYIEVTRVSADRKSWADIRVQTWAVMWTKRQPLTDGTLPRAIPYNWNQADIDRQEADHVNDLRARGILQ